MWTTRRSACKKGEWTDGDAPDSSAVDFEADWARDFYGGWVTRNIKGKMKGGPGTWGW